jgi:queuine tRNA-ribosyltransferase
MTDRISFSLLKTDGRARLGEIATPRGVIRTPAFMPVGTAATVKAVYTDQLEAAGADIVLANTYHLMLRPGAERIARLGGLHEFMRWKRPIITDSGGFQVFSMGHGTVADEIKGRSRPSDRAGRLLSIDEEGARFRSYIDGSEHFLAPETSMEIQAALGSDIALAFDECTPLNVDREYTARSTERTHRWLRRCLDWHAEHGPDGQLLYGIVQGGVYEDMRAESVGEVMASGCPGIAIGGSLGADKPQMHEVVGWATAALGDDQRPRHLLGIGDIDDLIVGVGLGIDTFDCAMPTRLGRHGMALVPDSKGRWRVDLAKARWRLSDEPLMDGCPCDACALGYTRGYWHYLARARELTAQRLLTLHNLAYIARLMADLRAAIAASTLAQRSAELLAGAPV